MFVAGRVGWLAYPFPFKLRWREQYPRRWDSFEQPSFEHNRRHCFPLNFFLIPEGVDTTSPFLYLCGVAGRDLGDDGVEQGRPPEYGRP